MKNSECLKLAQLAVMEYKAFTASVEDRLEVMKYLVKCEETELILEKYQEKEPAHDEA